MQPFLIAHEKRKRKDKLIDQGLSAIYPCLLQLEQDWEFDKGRLALERELKNSSGPQLEEHLTGQESEEHAVKLVHRLVRRRLGVATKTD